MNGNLFLAVIVTLIVVAIVVSSILMNRKLFKKTKSKDRRPTVEEIEVLPLSETEVQMLRTMFVSLADSVVVKGTDAWLDMISLISSWKPEMNIKQMIPRLALILTSRWGVKRQELEEYLVQMEKDLVEISGMSGTKGKIAKNVLICQVAKDCLKRHLNKPEM